MRTNFAGSRAMQLLDNLISLRRAAHWIVQYICRSDLVSLEDPLDLHLGFDRGYAHRPTRLLSRPIEFGFGINYDDDYRLLLDWPVDCPPCARVEHAPPKYSTPAYLPTSLSVIVRSHNSKQFSSRRKLFHGLSKLFHEIFKNFHELLSSSIARRQFSVERKLLVDRYTQG